MRKLFSPIITIVLLTSVSFFAQDFSGVKICIDPGHGGHTSDDRYIEATGFWESDGNWGKANHLKEILESMGAEVILTRDGNENSDDLALSERAAVANNNNVDYFNSIHSNAFNGQSNYTLLLYNGTSSNPSSPEAKEMGGIMAEKIHEANRTTNDYNRADNDFLGFNLGVLRPLNMPGTLSEGSFHDYIPESYRLLNSSYQRHEAWAITRSFIQFYDLEELSHGALAGKVRDKFEEVDYYYINGTGDKKQPVNNIEVTLMPDSLVYHGDSNNNGFFLFDSLAPGEYTLIVDAQNYKADTSTVNIQANKTVFADRQLVSSPDYSPPQVVSSSPADGDTAVHLNTNITFNFDNLMNMDSTENAFSITPYMDGNFSWEDNQRRMIFDPTGMLQPGSEYTVTLSTSANSFFDVSMEEEYSFSFSTRSEFNLEYVYPENGQTDISTTVKIRAQFDAPIKASSLAGNVIFQDTSGNDIPITVYSNEYEKGRIEFEPEDPLQYDTPYRLELKEGISDVENLAFDESREIVFRTYKDAFYKGPILEDFESIGGWWDPEQSGSTGGTDGDNTTFTITTNRKYTNQHSAKLEYLFTEDSGGLVRAYNANKPSIGSDPNSTLAVWVYGDLSFNVLEYWFYYDGSTNARVVVDTLDWTGWQQKVVKMEDIPGSGDRIFHSLVVKQTENGLKTGDIYFDSVILTDSGVTSIDRDPANLPKEFALEQNYPNPFNPTTKIGFTIPKSSNVTLEIFNLLGEKVNTLIDNRRFSSGRYEFTWNAKDDYGKRLSSGVYMYRIKAGDFTQIKKMMLLK